LFFGHLSLTCQPDFKEYPPTLLPAVTHNKHPPQPNKSTNISSQTPSLVTTNSASGIFDIINRFERRTTGTAFTPKLPHPVAMASPEPSGRVAVPPRNGGGVKNLLAMFEKGAAASTPPSPKTPPVNREISPAPKPLGRVRTSFVAVNSKDGTGFGLQKLPVSPLSPGAENTGSPFGPALVSDAKPQDTSDPVKKQEEAPAQEEQKTEDPAPAPVEEATAKVETAETPSGNVPPTVTKADAKPATKEQGKKVAPKKEPVKKEPIKKEKAPAKPEASSSKTQTKPAPTTTKASVPRNLNVPPTSRSKVPSPLPSPTRKAPSHSRTASKDSIAKPKTKPMASKPPTKPQEPVLGVAPKSKAPVAAHKPLPKPDSKGATKPVELKGTASAPTASWVAKMGGAPAEAAPRRPPSSASMNRTSRSTERTLRRQKSLISDRKETVRHPRPATSAAHHTAPPPSSDFLSRMMRPTKSSASKVTEKVETTKFQPALRTGSAMGAHGEPHSPPRVKKTTSPNRIAKTKPEEPEATSPTRKTHFASDSEPEPIPEETEEEAPAPVQQEEAPVEQSRPQEEQVEAVVEKQEEQVETVVEEQKEVVESDSQEATPEETQPEVAAAAVERKTPELTISIDNTPKDNGEEVHTPTTTSSSATLVHEGDALEDAKQES
jgi:hypothetical protein